MGLADQNKRVHREGGGGGGGGVGREKIYFFTQTTSSLDLYSVS